MPDKSSHDAQEIPVCILCPVHRSRDCIIVWCVRQVRNRWHRLSSGQPMGAPAAADGGVAAAAGGQVVYKCSRCGQPKRNHICTAPDRPIAPAHGADAKAKREKDPHAPPESRLGWTRHEDDIILSSVNAFGPKWIEIAAQLPGRTEHAARNRYHRLTSKVL